MEKNMCETEYKIHSLLTKLKKEDKEKYYQVKRILTYLYKTIKVDYFEKKSIELALNDKKGKGVKQVVSNASQLLYKEYINGQDGILDNLINLCNDTENKYFEKFYDGIETFLEMSENNLYSDYKIYNYAFNIYVMLRTYQLNPHNYDTFSKVVDEYSSFFITSVLGFKGIVSSHLWGPEVPYFIRKKGIIDYLIAHKEYQTLPIIRENLKQVLNEINLRYESNLENEYDSLMKKYELLYKYIAELKEKEIVVFEETISALEKSFFDTINNSVRSGLFPDDYRRITNESINYFSKILLIGQRRNFFKDEINEVETNQKFINEIITYTEKMDYELFEYMNKELDYKEDSFITCMKIVFDSDTYHELISKLDDIVLASQKYPEDPKGALKIIEELKSDKHKEVINGVTLSWPKSNSINQIEKPKKIFERMLTLHQKLDYAPKKEDYIYFYSTSYRKIKDCVVEIKTLFARNERKEKEQQLQLEQERQLQEQQKQEQAVQKTKGSFFNMLSKMKQ